MVWYSHLLKNFPQFIVIYTVKDFGIVNEAESIYNSRTRYESQILVSSVISGFKLT